MSTLPTPKQKHWYTRKRYWILLVILILIIVSVSGAMKAFQQSQKEALSYLEQKVTVEKADSEKTISATGAVVVDHSQVVVAAVAGTVNDVRVSVGDSVTRDQVLFTIDSTIPASAAQKEVKAPFDGRVLSLSVFKEGSVTPGVPVAVVGYNSTHVEFAASDAEVVALSSGQVAHLSVPSVNGGRDIYEGAVSFVDIQKSVGAQNFATGQTESGYRVTVTADALPADIRNRLGLVIDIEIVTDKREGIVVVDRSAIQYDDEDRSFVYRAPALTEEFYAKAITAEEIADVLERVEVTTGFEGDETIEITAGLKVSDNVLLYIPKAEASSPF